MSRKRKTPGEKYSEFEISAHYNQLTYNDYYVRMCDLYMNLYKYNNLPVSIDPRFLHQQLMLRNGVAFFRDDEMDEIYALPFNPTNVFDNQGNPTEVEVYGMNGYHAHLKHGEFALMWSNYMRVVPINTIELFAQRISEIQRSIDVNIANQKTAKVVKVTQNNRLTVKNILKSIAGNVPVIEVDEAFNTGDLESIDLTTPYVTDKMDVHKNVVWNEFLTWCGVENSNMDKKERLVANEVMGNYGNVEMGRNTGLSARQEGLDWANELFGLDMSVEFNSNIPTMLNAPELVTEERGDTKVIWQNIQ